MGIEVYKSGASSYRLIQVEFKEGDRERKRIPKQAYPALGFDPTWTIEEARKYASQLNKKAQIERVKIAAAARRAEESALYDATLIPQHIDKKFLKRLEEEAFGSDDRYSTLVKHWNTTKRLLLDLRLLPADYYDERMKIYNWLRERQYSIDYIKRITRLLNLWGKFFARLEGSFFEPLPKMSTSLIQRFIDAREEKEHVRQAAKPLLWIELKNTEATFINEGLEQQWNWLMVACWFGLRPKEVDSLKTAEGKFWKVAKAEDIDALFVYQTKLRGLAKDQRWKVIPIYFKEQKRAMLIVRSGLFKRPLVKTLNRLLGGGVDTYSPRKAFTDMMRDHGFGIEDIAVFMGHRSLESFTGDRRIDMTWKHYKDKMKFKLPKKEEAG